MEMLKLIGFLIIIIFVLVLTGTIIIVNEKLWIGIPVVLFGFFINKKILTK